MTSMMSLLLLLPLIDFLEPNALPNASTAYHEASSNGFLELLTSFLLESLSFLKVVLRPSLRFSRCLRRRDDKILLQLFPRDGDNKFDDDRFRVLRSRATCDIGEKDEHGDGDMMVTPKINSTVFRIMVIA